MRPATNPQIYQAWDIECNFATRALSPTTTKSDVVWFNADHALQFPIPFVYYSPLTLCPAGMLYSYFGDVRLNVVDAGANVIAYARIGTGVIGISDAYLEGDGTGGSFFEYPDSVVNANVYPAPNPYMLGNGLQIEFVPHAGVGSEGGYCDLPSPLRIRLLANHWPGLYPWGAPIQRLRDEPPDLFGLFYGYEGTGDASLRDVFRLGVWNLFQFPFNFKFPWVFYKSWQLELIGPPPDPSIKQIYAYGNVASDGSLTVTHSEPELGGAPDYQWTPPTLPGHTLYWALRLY